MTAEHWISTADRLPPEGEVVIVLNGDTETTLKRRGSMWFFPDGSMYVYYTPKVWRPAH
jgi:hypothetical protein